MFYLEKSDWLGLYKQLEISDWFTSLYNFETKELMNMFDRGI